jgi:glycosyltransferase involved in cell wall biosynthesis
MRLGIDCREFEGGGATGMARMLRGLIGWISSNRPDISLVLYATREPADVFFPPGARVRLLPDSPTVLWDQVLLPRALARDNIDVYYSIYHKCPLTAPCPAVITVHDLIPIKMPEKGAAAKAKKIYLSTMLPLYAAKASRVATDSEFSKKEISGAGVDAAKIQVIYPGLPEGSSPEKNPAKIKAAAAKAGLSPGGYIFYLGHLRASKNVESLVRAHAALPPVLRKNHKLAVAGAKSGEFERLCSLAGELGCSPDIVFVGYVNDAEAAALAAGCSVFVYPSKYEGFGYPPLEAMSLGAPVVCSNAASLPEVVGDAAVVVDPEPEAIADGIARVLTEPGLRESLIEKGARRARLFTVDKMASEYVDMFERVAAESLARGTGKRRQ